MGFHRGPNTVTEGLKLSLDAGNEKSYPGTGTIWYDKSGNGFNGTFTNGPTYSGGSIVFDGVDDYVTTPDPLLPQYNWTIEVVLKCNDFSNSPIFLSPISAGIDHYLRFTSAGKLGFQLTTAADVGNRGSSSNYTAAIGETVHATFIRTATYQSIFVNGQLDRQDSDTVASAAWDGTWRFGTRGNTTFAFNGNIYSTRAYSRVLTDEEILQNYNATKARFGL